jgi:hypothetical protein
MPLLLGWWVVEAKGRMSEKVVVANFVGGEIRL